MNAQLSHSEEHPSSFLPARQPSPAERRRNPRQVMIVLSICMALQMTGYVMILPLFARRFSDFGAGVESLSASAMAYALASTVAAPFMGAMADRVGRRRLVLVSLAVYVVAFTGYLLASSAPAFIVMRGLAGALTAGLIPAVTGIVADMAPSERRAQWIGIVNGGGAIGWIAGPVLGGVFYDHWGYAAALIVSIIMAVTAFVMAFLTVPETRLSSAILGGKAAQPDQPFQIGDVKSLPSALRQSLPASISAFVLVLWIYFADMFAWAFIEPRFMFYAYDDLRWNASMLGLMMSTFGISLTLGEFGLGQLSDRLGRKPVIVLGLVLFSAQFVGLALSANYVVIASGFVLAGLGSALIDPALSAALLDIAPPKHQARLLGLKSTAGSVGNILGPALVVLFTASLSARGVFLAAAGTVLVAALLTVARPLGTQSSRVVFEPDKAEGKTA